jgi:hypothetical protein
MLLREITEGVATVFGHKKRSGTKGHVARKYRCTSGPRKGRVVAKAATCNAPKKMSASNTLKRTRRSKGSTIDIKRSRTFRTSPTTKRLAKVNTGRRRIKPRKRTGARSGRGGRI